MPKAALTARKVAFPRTHDLGALLNLLPASELAHFNIDLVTGLTVWAVEGRYPGEVADATKAEAESAYLIARDVDCYRTDYELMAARQMRTPL